jgi:CheY-like chemotaxis protein
VKGAIVNEPPEAGRAAPGEAPRILMFEDSAETMGGLRDYLVRRQGWAVDLTADESVLERLATERYDLILLDVMIHSRDANAPDAEQQNVSYAGVPWRTTGLHLLRRLREGAYAGEGGTSKDVPVIIVSAALSSSVRSEVERIGDVYGVFEKPFVLADLMEAMRKALKPRLAA